MQNCTSDQDGTED